MNPIIAKKRGRFAVTFASLFALASACAQTAPAPSAAAATATATTADNPELAAKKTAAAAYLKKDSIKFSFLNTTSATSSSQIREFEAYPSRGKLKAFQSRDRCEAGELTATVDTNDDGDVVVRFSPAFEGGGCVKASWFVLNPLTKQVKRYSLQSDGRTTKSGNNYSLVE